ncbi:MAG TPA: hypothetical protein VGS58_04665, partial [Candidatus Sulfopaludibacter sp.]|nr:hypothetical protein [Candidatus Sulfopaludibacter sp.]
APAAPSPLANYVTVTPHFGAPIFNLAVNIISSRTAAWVDPDFTNSPGVQSSTYAVAPNPNPQAQDAPFSLTDFASQLQSAIPDVYVATGDAVTEFDPASAGTLWLVNFGNAAGPDITWQFNWSLPTYFALPPLCTALLGGPVDVTPYQSGQPMKGPDVSQNFQAVDLDDWMRTFLGAVDLFLSPAYASGAYPIDPDDVNKVIAGKEAIAEAMSAGLEIVLTSQQGQGNIADAIAAMKQAMLAQLSQAYSIDTLVQAPVTVTSPVSDPSSAPRLSGKLLVTPGSQNLGSTPDSYSFSTAKVSLVNPNPPAVPAPAATFLFSVKNPAANKDVSLSVQFEATDIEIPDPQAAFDGYEGSYWLKLVSPGTSVQSAAGSIDIPVPLRSYPSPVLLASQTAIQTVADPQAPTDLIGWNLQFIYNHDDAEQDMPLAVITFNPADTNNGAPPAPVNPLTQRIFQALARFIAVFPQLQQDLTLLKQAPPASNDVAKYAVQAFAKLAEGVADAFQMDMALAVESGLTEIVYAYTFEKNSSGGTLQTLTVTTVDPETGAPITLTSPIWPAIVAFPNGVAQQLQAQQVPPNQMQYTYQGSIPADLAFEQQLYFNVAAPSNPAPMAPPGMPNAQVFSFGNQNVFLEQSGRAGISVTRNLNLVGTPTNPDFVYQTPLTSFSNVAVPFIYATGDISIGSGNPATPGLVAQALGAFLQKLLTSQNTWQDGDTIDIRIAASYSYSLAAGTTQDTPQLGALVPITFVPDYSFNPNTDWQPASGSFVTQLDQIVGNWYSTNQPVVSNGYYVFDLTVYAAAGDFQPLIRATSLRYQLLSS